MGSAGHPHQCVDGTPRTPARDFVFTGAGEKCVRDLASGQLFTVISSSQVPPGGASRERGETRGGGWHRAEDPETLAHHRLEDLWRMWCMCCPQAHEVACSAVWQLISARRG